MNLTVSLYPHMVSDLNKRNELLSDLAHRKDDLTVVIGFKEVSRFSSFKKEECFSLAKELSEKGIKVMLQWDILMSEDIFGGLFYGLKKEGLFEATSDFSGVRVQDPGLLYALKEENFPGDIHFITEQGNHNLIGLVSWLKVWPEKIKRLVLSPQLPAKKLEEYANALANHPELPGLVELEVLAFGPLLLFYTPRKLVSPLYGEEQEVYQLQGTSEESPHKGFPIIENQHGTFMLNTKDQFIFDEVLLKEEELARESHLSWRVDLICGLGEAKLEDLFKAIENKDNDLIEKVKLAYARALTKGFFRVNKTDVLFKKLKNHRLQDRDKSFVGEVVDVKKKNHVAVLIKSQEGLKTGDHLRLLSPEGREKFVVVERMTNALKDQVEIGQKGEIVFIPPVGGISVRSMVFQDQRG